jgi:hypothetical protein
LSPDLTTFPVWNLHTNETSVEKSDLHTNHFQLTYFTSLCLPNIRIDKTINIV